MKKIIIITCIALLGFSHAFAQGIEFEKGTYAEALAKAKAENKMIFMDCYTVWCGPCKKLAKDIFTQPEVGKFFNENFVNVKIDMEKGVGIELQKKHNVSAFPTLMFLDAEGENLHRRTGFLVADTLIAEAKKALDPALRASANYRRWDDGNRDPEFVSKLVLQAIGDSNHEYMKAIGMEYVSKLSYDDMLNPYNFDIITRYSNSRTYKTEMFKHIKSNQEKYINSVGSKQYGMFMFMNYSKYLDANKDSLSDKELDKIIEEYLKQPVNHPAKMYAVNKVYEDRYIRDKEWEKLIDVWLREVKRHHANGNLFPAVSGIKSAAGKLLQNPKYAEVDRSAIEKLAFEGDKYYKSSKEVLEEAQGSCWALAYLYIKLENKQKAQEWYDVYKAYYAKRGITTGEHLDRIKEALKTLD